VQNGVARSTLPAKHPQGGKGRREPVPVRFRAHFA
jgi:hypothetical protein